MNLNPVSPRNAHFVADPLGIEELPRQAGIDAPHQADVLEVAEEEEVGADAQVESAGPLDCITDILGTCLGAIALIIILPVIVLGIACLYLDRLGQSIIDEIEYQYEARTDWLFPKEKIPDALHGDPLFAEHICPIMMMPIRFPVRDRNQPDHVYEKSAILKWIKAHGTSPITRRGMTPEDLLPHVELQNQIEARLAELQRRDVPPAPLGP